MKCSQDYVNKRDTRIDLAKGILISLVVVGHAIQYSLGSEYCQSKQFFNNFVFKLIYSFHMPLFMMISGYLFYYSNKKPFKVLLFSKFKSIGIPLLAFTLLCHFYGYMNHLLGGYFLHTLIVFFKDVFGWTMWYLSSLLMNIIIMAIITRIILNKALVYVTIILVFFVSMFISDDIILYTHKYMFPFFCIGYCLQENNIKLYYFSDNKLVFIALTMLTLACLLWFDYETYVYTSGFCIIGDYLNQFLTNLKRMIIALVVSYTFMQYLYLLSKKGSNVYLELLNKLGKISLFIYGFNMFVDIYYPKVLHYYSIRFEFNYFVPFLFTITLISISLFLYKIIERNAFLSFLLLGK